MANYENIRPYSKLNHIAAQYGGVHIFLKKIAVTNQRIGYTQGKKAGIWQGVANAGIAFAFWKGGKIIYRRIKKLYDNNNHNTQILPEESNNEKNAQLNLTEKIESNNLKKE